MNKNTLFLFISFCFCLPYAKLQAQCNSCLKQQFPNSVRTILGSETWSTPGFCLDQDIVIASGGELNITVSVDIVKDVLIRVQAGGKLNIIGPNVTLALSSACSSGDSWQGIQIDGDANHGPQQYSTPKQTGCCWDVKYYTNQGLIKGYDATFKDMTSGIYSQDGGIIVMTKCSFINNYRSIRATNYEYDGWKANIASLAEECYFEWTQPFFTTFNDQVFIEFYNNAGFEIAGCTFINASTSDISIQFNDRARGTGIRSKHSNFIVHQTHYPYTVYDYGDNCHTTSLDEFGCPKYGTNPIKSIFKYLSYGIDADNSGQSDKKGTITIAHSEFNENHVDINAKEIYNNSGMVDDPIVTIGKDNTFGFDKGTFDIKFDVVSGYRKIFVKFNIIKKFVIAHNTFSSNKLGEQSFVAITSTGNAFSRIYGNSFNSLSSNNSSAYANWFDEVNSQLKIECNEYSGFEHDWYLTNDATISTHHSEKYKNEFTSSGVNVYIEPGNANLFTYDYCNIYNSPTTNNQIIFDVNGVTCSTLPICKQLRCGEDALTNLPEEQNEVLRLEYFPNPIISGGILNINCAEPITQIRVTNLMGHTIVIKENSNIQQIQLPSLPFGIYFLNCTTSKGNKASLKVLVYE